MVDAIARSSRPRGRAGLRTVASLALILLAAVGGRWWASRSDLRAGEAAYQARRYAEAITCLERIPEGSGAYPRARRLIADARRAIEETDAAAAPTPRPTGAPAPTADPCDEALIRRLHPFPDSLDALHRNAAALKAATAISRAGGLKLDNFGKAGPKGWHVSFEGSSGAFVTLGCDADDSGWVSLLRVKGGQFEHLLGLQDSPSEAECHAAGITPAEYEEHVRALVGSRQDEER